MDIIILKSFIPEIFISLAIFFQLLFNAHIINKLNFNFPFLNQEMFVQTFFILICSFFLLLNLKIEGFFSNFLFLNDQGCRIIKILFIFCCVSVLVFLFRSFSTQKLNFFEFFSVFLFSIFSSLLLISSFDLISAYLSIEMQALCFYILASFRRNSAFSTEAGLKYFIMGSFISCIFLLGAALIYGVLGTLNFNGLCLLLSFPFEAELIFVHSFLLLGITCIVITLLFKVSAVPFHFWAPDVYEGAPLSSTIIFSVLPKTVIFFFLVRFLFSVSDFFFFIKYLFLCSGIASVFIGTFFSLQQKRLKRLLIFSSIAQVGFLVAALSSNVLDNFSSIFFFLIVYVITSILIWGHYAQLHNSKNFLDLFYNKKSSPIFLSSISNIFKVNKLWAFSFVIIFFSIAGIPPLSGFLAKLFILISLIESNSITFSFLLILISVVSVFYYIRVVKVLFFEGESARNQTLTFIAKDNSLELECLIFSLFIFFLVFFFFYPTVLLLTSQKIVLSLSGS